MQSTRTARILRRFLSPFAVASLVLALAPVSRAGETLYACGQGAGTSAIYSIDTATGEASLVWSLPNLYVQQGGLAHDAATDDFYAIGATVADPGTSRLFRISRSTGSITAYPGMSASLNLWSGGLAIHPLTGVLYATGSNGQQSSALFTIDTSTGAPTFVGQCGGQCCVTPFGFNLHGLGFRDDGTLFANGFTLSEVGSQLFTIDTATGVATAVGHHGVTVGSQLAQSDLAFRADGTLLSMGALTASTSGLYSVDPTTGAATAIGNLVLPLGNTGGLVFVDETPPITYCTAKTNSKGCVPKIGWSGTLALGDATPFVIDAQNVLNKKNGLFFYGLSGPAALPFLGGTLCTTPPVRRTAVQNSGGTLPPALDCSGTYVFDFDAWYASGIDPALDVGRPVCAQFWSRDVQSSNGVGLTDALFFYVTR